MLLPTDVQKRLEAIAQRDHRSPKKLAAEVLASFVSEEEAEMRLIAERSQLAKSGVARVPNARMAEWLRFWGHQEGTAAAQTRRLTRYGGHLAGSGAHRPSRNTRLHRRAQFNGRRGRR